MSSKIASVNGGVGEGYREGRVGGGNGMSTPNSPTPSFNLQLEIRYLGANTLQAAIELAIFGTYWKYLRPIAMHIANMNNIS